MVPGIKTIHGSYSWVLLGNYFPQMMQKIEHRLYLSLPAGNRPRPTMFGFRSLDSRYGLDVPRQAVP